jgi:hypothetical protein
MLWSLFQPRRDLDAEVYSKLRPGDLYGEEDRSGRPPEAFARHLLLVNASLLAFAAVMLFRVGAETPAHGELVAAAWLAAMGMAIVVGAWIALRLSRKGEAKALSATAGNPPASSLPPPVQATMKKAAIGKMLAFRLMIVSAFAGCVGIYAGIKSFFLL